MPRPFRQTITSKSTVNELIRADKDRFIRSLYASVGPVEFYRRRLEWLRVHGKTTSYNRLVAFLQARGIDVSDQP
jgi:hypothetical protein